MNTDDAKIPNDDGNWRSIEIYLFSNGQQYSPPRKYHLDAEELDWWEITLNQLARSHYGIQSWEKRQARKKAGEDYTCNIKDIDKSESIELLMPATKQTDQSSLNEEFVTTVYPKPETRICNTNDNEGFLNKSETESQSAPNKVYENEQYDIKPSKQHPGTDIKKGDENSNDSSNQKLDSSRQRNSEGVQDTDYYGEPNNNDQWTNKIAAKSKAGEKERKRSFNERFEMEAERVLGSIDSGFQKRKYEKPLEDYDSGERTTGSICTQGTTRSLTHKPRLSDGSRTGQQITRSGEYGSKERGNVTKLNKVEPISGQNDKTEAKMDMLKARRNKQENIPNDQKVLTVEQINTRTEDLKDVEDDRENRREREEIPEKNYSKTKTNEFKLEEEFADVRDKGQKSELKRNGVEYKSQPSNQKSTQDEYIRKSSQQKPRDENINEYIKAENKSERRISEQQNNNIVYKSQSSEQRGGENEYIRRSSQQKPTNESKVREPRSSKNENVSENNNTKNKNEHKTSKLNSNDLANKGQPREKSAKENEYIRKLSQEIPGHGINGSNVGGPRSFLNKNISEYNNTKNKFERKISETKGNSNQCRGQISEQRGRENEHLRKSSLQKPRNEMRGSQSRDPRSSVLENISQYYKTENKYDQSINDKGQNDIEYKDRPIEQKDDEAEYVRKLRQQKPTNEMHRNQAGEVPRNSGNENSREYNNVKNKNEQRTSELKSNGIEYKGQPSEQRGRENEYIRKLSLQNPRNGMNGSKVGEPVRERVNENKARINKTRTKDPGRNNQMSMQKIKETDPGSRFDESQSKRGDIRIRGSSGPDTERKSSVLKTADVRTKPFMPEARTSIKEKICSKPKLGVLPVQEDETPLGDIDINDRIGGPNTIVNDVNNRTFEPAIRLDNIGENEVAEVTYNTETQRHECKRTSSTRNSWNHYPKTHMSINQNPFSKVPNESEEKIVTKDNTYVTDFISHKLEKQKPIAKYPIKQTTAPEVSSPRMEINTQDTNPICISNLENLATDIITKENVNGNTEIITVSTNLFRNTVSEIASMRLNSVKDVIGDIKDGPDQMKKELISIQQSVASIHVNEGVQTYAEVCDAAEQHGHGVVEFNTTKMQRTLPNLRDSMVAINDKENIISILNKGDIFNFKLNIEVINGESSQNATRKSRSLTNIAATERGSQVMIEDDLYVQSKSLQSFLNEETGNGSGFEGHPKVVVVQCACCDGLNNSPLSDLPACCDSKKYFVLLPACPHRIEDRCNCETPHQPLPSTLQHDVKQMSSFIPIKKAYSNMELETTGTNKNDTERSIALINSTSQTDDAKSESQVTKRKVSMTEDSLKFEFRKESISQMSVANHAVTSSCRTLFPQTNVQQTEDPVTLQPPSQSQVGSKISRGVLKQCLQASPDTFTQAASQTSPQTLPQFRSQICSQEQSKYCPRVQSQNRLQEHSQNNSPVQLKCCPHTCHQVQFQGCPQICPQNQTRQQEQPQNLHQTHSQAQSQAKSQTCPSVQIEDSTRVPAQSCRKGEQLQSQECSQPEVAKTCLQLQPQRCPNICPEQKIPRDGPPDQSTDVFPKVCVQMQSKVGPSLTAQATPQICCRPVRQNVSHTHTQTQWCGVM
ncbi:hypothetical protein HF086_005041, partial [Spodoptera exigua]